MTACAVARGRSRPAQWRSLEQHRRVAPNGDSFFIGGEKNDLDGLAGLEGWLFSVADGLGGEGNDDQASQAAVGELDEIFNRKKPVENKGYTDPAGWLRAVYDQVNDHVCSARESLGLSGMYTTLTSALIISERDGPKLYPANVGDSRLYLARRGTLTALTQDDGENGFISRVVGDPSLFAEPQSRYATTLLRTPDCRLEVLREIEMSLAEEIKDKNSASARTLAPLFLQVLEGACPVDMAPELSRGLGVLKERLGYSSFRALVDALAVAYVRIALSLPIMSLEAGDRLLLCSDGISNAFSHDELEAAVVKAPSGKSSEEELDATLDWLLETPGRVDDDRTGVLVQIEEN